MNPVCKTCGLETEHCKCSAAIVFGLMGILGIVLIVVRMLVQVSR